MRKIFHRLNSNKEGLFFFQEGFALLDAILWTVLVSYVFLSLMLMTTGMARSAAKVVQGYQQWFARGYEYESYSRRLYYESGEHASAKTSRR